MDEDKLLEVELDSARVVEIEETPDDLIDTHKYFLLTACLEILVELELIDIVDKQNIDDTLQKNDSLWEPNY